MEAHDTRFAARRGGTGVCLVLTNVPVAEHGAQRLPGLEARDLVSGKTKPIGSLGAATGPAAIWGDVVAVSGQDGSRSSGP